MLLVGSFLFFFSFGLFGFLLGLFGLGCVLCYILSFDTWAEVAPLPCDSPLTRTETLCVDEIERLEANQAVDAPVQHESADLVSVFGWLFRRPGGDSDMSDDGLGSHDDQDTDESRRGARVARQYIATLSERIEAVEDSVGGWVPGPAEISCWPLPKWEC
jgi:hypothetical protein